MRATTFVTAAVAVCVCVLLPAAAQGTPTDVRATATEEIATDYPTADEQRDAAIMDPLVEALSMAVGESDREVPTIDGAPNRYAGFKVDYPAHRIDLYWAGEVPESIRALIRSHPDVDVATHVAEYSQIEMLEARDRIAAERSSLEQTLGTLLSVGPDYQGRGLKVQTSSGTDLGRRAANSVVDDISEVPIFSLEANVGEITTFAGSRQNDTSPHYGGAGVLITNVAQTKGGYCTTGASVVGRSTGTKYMTTALHCMEEPGAPDVEIDSKGYVFNAAGTLIGSWRWDASQLDKSRHAILIKLKDGSTNSGRAYWGAYTSSTSQPWEGVTTSPIGASICTLGANTGAHCGGIVTDNNFLMFHGPAQLDNMVKAAHETVALAGNGDSGGPVSRTVNGERRLAGFILGGPPNTTSAAECSTSMYIPTSQGTKCSKVVYYTGGMASTLDELGVDLR